MSLKAPAPISRKIGGFDDDQPQSVGRNLGRPAFVVYTPLYPSMHAADGELAGLIEVRDRFVVLALLILDHESMPRVVSIHGEPACPTATTRVADQPIKKVLAAGGLSENRIA